ncbi:LPXTG-motif cell wall-anchored protein/TQXA domain-containing protein [Stackebrandtia endophytica]|uniref:LPXTG-motif cell wall-anchored protein/TQXA domain-containing protein n=1 Tax=Stackebrandtia endophytica TaxID=1496996 RepID=A0A543AWV3_9ACTN|nr:thioester domain-containing protein [Stackebrandtia endophytica]TQL77058.1 LPXTG-motif cell wall-anchored protein/TQXA domain-containing protein [Stackebrandtia endophytica]
MKKNWLRAAVALSAAGALGLAMAGTAGAEENEPTPARGVVTKSDGWYANGDPTTYATRISITPEGSDTPVLAYCIDIHTSLDAGYIYEEGAWDSSNVENLAQVQWILHNSYPTATPEALATAAGVELTGEMDGDKIAYTATQAAIWSFTDGFTLNQDDAVTGHRNETIAEGTDEVVAAIYNHLTANATEMPEPITELSFSGPTTGDVSEKIGPFSVTTPGGDATLSIEGGRLIDADDNEIDTVANGGEFYIRPDDGATEIKVTGTATVTTPTGTVFLATDEAVGEVTESSKIESQKLILAEVIQGETEAEMTLEVDAAPRLPVTGLSLTNSLLLGAALLIAGAVVLVVIRRRRTAATWGDAA